MKKQITTTFTNMIGDNELCTMKNKPQLIGSCDSEMRSLLDDIWSLFVQYGLKYHWDCIDKTRIAFNQLNSRMPYTVDNYNWRPVAGRMFVCDKITKWCYGFEFNPPLEFHCWLENKNGLIIDMGLSGVISAGLKAKDDRGYLLMGITPFNIAWQLPRGVLTYNKKIDLIDEGIMTLEGV